MRTINKIIIHHSQSDIKGHDNIKVIKEWHLERGFKDVGYHYFITKNGTIQRGRDLAKVGAHCKGQNKSSIGICLSGDKKYSYLQFCALDCLIRSLRIKLGKPKLKVYPHSKYSDKICPNFDVNQFLNDKNL